MSKKRPGVGAAIRLSQCDNVETWDAVSTQWQDVMADHADLDQRVTQLGQALQAGTKDYLTRSELLQTIIPWKFAVGKPRPALRKYLESNSTQAVETCTRQGVALARRTVVSSSSSSTEKLSQSIKAAMTAVTQLAGVGPATASLVLSLVRPDVFSYMFDEVIDCFLPRRTYTLGVYLECNATCRALAARLKDWTAARVARTLWTAARVCASSAGKKEQSSWKDHTLLLLAMQPQGEKHTTDNNRDVLLHRGTKRQRKR